MKKALGIKAGLVIALGAVSGHSLAIGLFASVIHSLQEPAYSLGMGNPASFMAKRLWHAVTPEPQ